MCPTCPHCGEEQVIDLFEVWNEREFLFETCCYELHEAIVEEMNGDPSYARRLLEELGYGQALGGKVRRTADVDGQLVLDFALEIRPVPWAQARAFIAEHHRHCAPPAGWRFGAGAFNGSELVAVVVVGRPVARALDASQVVEVNRLCTRGSDPLAWNACSQLYGWAAREAKRRGFKRVITYTLEHEAGTTLRAAGWSIDGTVRGRSWNTPSRPRDENSPTANKTRWARELLAA